VPMLSVDLALDLNIRFGGKIVKTPTPTPTITRRSEETSSSTGSSGSSPTLTTLRGVSRSPSRTCTRTEMGNGLGLLEDSSSATIKTMVYGSDARAGSGASEGC
jgi:hypothetical protein